MEWLRNAWEAAKARFSPAAPETVVTPCPGALTEAEAQSLFDEMKAQIDIPFDYPRDCCYARAQRMTQLMADRGIASQKAWAWGDLNPTTTDGAPVLFPPGTGTPVTWRYHVAPTVSVRSADGSCRDMVIDPSLRDEPITISEWEELMGGARYSAQTPSSVYYHEPVAGGAPFDMHQTDVPAGELVDGPFARHVDARDTALGR